VQSKHILPATQQLASSHTIFEYCFCVGLLWSYEFFGIGKLIKADAKAYFP